MPIKQDTDRFVKDYADGIRALREKIAALIGNLPDNSNIARLPGSGNCFVMGSRNLSMNRFRRRIPHPRLQGGVSRLVRSDSQ